MSRLTLCLKKGKRPDVRVLVVSYSKDCFNFDIVEQETPKKSVDLVRSKRHLKKLTYLSLSEITTLQDAMVRKSSKAIKTKFKENTKQ